MADINDLLTTTEISNIFKVNRVTVTQWINSGKLPAIKTLGGYHRVPRESLIRFLQENNMPIPRGLQPNPSTPDTGSGKLPAILVVEDDIDLLKILQKKLRDAYPDIQIEVANNGVSALIKLGQIRPDLLILDIVMPEMDGLEVIRRIKLDPDLAGIKIIAISGHAEKEKAALMSGADAFFSKRGRYEDLIDRLPEYISIVSRA